MTTNPHPSIASDLIERLRALIDRRRLMCDVEGDEIDVALNCARQALSQLTREVDELRAALTALEAAMKRDLGAGYAGVALAQAALSRSNRRGSDGRE